MGEYIVGESIISLVLGVIVIILGLSNLKGNISSLHFYHRYRVSEQDRMPFGKMVGLGTIIIGVAISLYGFLTMLEKVMDRRVYADIGMVILILGLVVGLGISFYAMIKYNKGIF